jgi:hypothetical protein
VIRGCPRLRVDAESKRALRLADFADRGILPRAGGYEDQRHRDVILIQLATNEIAIAIDEAKPKENDDG